jgi:hypothetical protein
MPNPNQVVGQVKIKIDGETLLSKPGATLEIGGATRTAQEGDNDAGAFSESTAPSKVTATLLMKKGVSLAAIRNMDNGTLTFETDIGTTYIIRNAYSAEAPVLTAGGEGANVVFQGPPAEELG